MKLDETAFVYGIKDKLGIEKMTNNEQVGVRKVFLMSGAKKIISVAYPHLEVENYEINGKFLGEFTSINIKLTGKFTLIMLSIELFKDRVKTTHNFASIKKATEYCEANGLTETALLLSCMKDK